MNTYNLKLNKETINKLSTGNYNIKGYDQDNNILVEPKDITVQYKKEIDKLQKILDVKSILDYLNPLPLDERYKILEDVKVSLDEIDGNDL